MGFVGEVVVALNESEFLLFSYSHFIRIRLYLSRYRPPGGGNSFPASKMTKRTSLQVKRLLPHLHQFLLLRSMFSKNLLLLIFLFLCLFSRFLFDFPMSSVTLHSHL